MERHHQSRRLRVSALASAISALVSTAGGAGAALAQEAEQQAALDEITVTGSRIVRRDFTANSPILTIDQELFDDTMSIGIEHVLNQLPQFVPAITQFLTSETQSTATVTPGASTLSLRGLGSNRNLILIDGRRAMPVNASGAVDINSLPSAAIQRVETITGGASSVYGADAMAGVVNFILKRDYQGVEFDARYGQSQEGDGGELRVSAVFGANFADGEGNVLMGFEHSSRDQVLQADRRFYRRGWANPTNSFGSAFRLSDSFYQVDPSNAPSAAAVADVFEREAGQVGTGGSFFFNADGTVYRSTADGNHRHTGPTLVNGLPFRKFVQNDPDTPSLNGQLVENNLDARLSIPLDRNAVFGRGHLSIADNVSAFMQANFSKNETRTLLIYSPALGAWGNQIPYGEDLYAPSIDADGNTLPPYREGGTFGLSCPAVGGCTNSEAFPVSPDLAALLDSRQEPNAPWSLGHVMDYAGQRRTENRITSYQILAGVEGRLPNQDMTWEAYVSHGTTQVVTNLLGYGTTERFRFVVTQPNYGRGLFFVGNEPGGGFGSGAAECTTGLPTVFRFQPSDDCIRSVTANMQDTAEMEQNVVEVNLQGRVVDMPAGEARFAAGASYRENLYFFNPDMMVTMNGFLDNAMGLFPRTRSEGQISTREVYGELLLPLLRDRPAFAELNLELGYRYSDNEPTGSVDTYKGLFDWSITPRFRLRGGRQVANRAPNIAELFQARTQTLGGSAIGDLCSMTNPVSPLSANPDLNPDWEAARAICEFHMGPTGAATFYDPDFVEEQPTGIGFVFANTTGNPNLMSETAHTMTFGAVMQLADRASLTVDWYEIKIRDMIAAQSVDVVYRLCFDPQVNPTLDPTFGACNLLVRDPVTGTRQATDVSFSNDSAIDTQGVDLQFNWGTNLGPGDLTLNLLTSYLLSNKTRLDPEQEWIEWKGSSGPSGLSGVQGGSYRYRTFTTMNYFQNNWNVSLRWRHLPDRWPSARITNPASTTQRPGSYDIFDLSGGVRFGDSWRLRFGIENLLDTQPPFTNRTDVNTGSGTDATFYDVLGRRGYAAMTLTF